MSSYTFEFQPTIDPQTVVNLEYSKDDLEEAAKAAFSRWVRETTLSEAIELACGSFWQEGEENALQTLVSNGGFWSYLVDDCGFLKQDAVIEAAEQAAIDKYLGRV